MKEGIFLKFEIGIVTTGFLTRSTQPSDPLLDLKNGSGDQGSYANHQRDTADSQDLHESLFEPVSGNQSIENSSQAVSVNPTVKQVLDGILRWSEKKPTTRSRKTEGTPSVITSDEWIHYFSARENEKIQKR
ncbi:hypothetical protein DMENIID0001_095130 [Sergentomyia squamirostris]